MTAKHTSQLLIDVSPDLERALIYGDLPPAQFLPNEIRCETVKVSMRDGTRLATDVYLPPERPAPVIAMRTPYGRSTDSAVGVFLSLARRGYAVVSQDCRGTGDSEPEAWDYYVFESEDSYDCVEWITRQRWFGGFIGAVGASYVGQTQWCMATHSAMSTIVPTVSGLGIAFNSAHLYMFLNAYARTIGKGHDKVFTTIYDMERLFEPETMAGGYFNEPLHQPLPRAIASRYPQLGHLRSQEAKCALWKLYCGMSCTERAELIRQALNVHHITSVEVEAMTEIFGPPIAHDALTIPHPDPADACQVLHAPALVWTGWYDWALNDALATWTTIRREGKSQVAERTRLLITPYAHHLPGYHEGMDSHMELVRLPTLGNQLATVLHWYDAVRQGNTDAWPAVIYYLMGANEWRLATDWPIPEAEPLVIYLGEGHTLTDQPPSTRSLPDRYTYDPANPTPTVGGSILSFRFPPGSVDVSRVQQRTDVLAYTTPALERDLTVVGPVRMILYVSSTAMDTDFVARLSDVFPDGRAIQLQNGILRTRYRNPNGDATPLEPGQICCLEIDLWATANRFKAGHRLRIDISSADFPRFDRHTNRSGESGAPILAQQTIYHGLEHPSHLTVQVLYDDA